jgi:thioredoxin reductase (NADPH)
MDTEETLIVGAGPIGLACAISARRRGLDPLVIDAGAIVNSIVRYPIGMGFFTTPDLLEIGGHPIVCAGAKPTREEAMMYYRGVVRTEQLRVRTFTRLVTATRDRDTIVAELDGLGGPVSLRTQRLVIATGYYDNPRPLDIPGANLPHVARYFDEAHRHSGLDVVVIGGNNSPPEAALLLFRAGARVTLVYRGTTFPPSVKYWIRPDLENRIAAGEIAARLGSTVERITSRAVVIRRADGAPEEIPADRVFALIGFHPDIALFRRCGIEVDDATGRPTHDPATLETNVPGIHIAGSVTAGFRTGDIFIENGRFDGERIFTDVRAAVQPASSTV